ncbi:phosphatidate cytidylyltransferase [Novosphingobium pentaromativorans]|uniref:Phosphatidate cytidylyltransferase n=1 Tax=Novosphingobium pentaromativorans US6-1 TaxID=1088721 RepID=G6EEX3_9SPHN|nr:phosphatidate cytidylyltransferase [Novosphingobium pentaromativorans]AIT79304.1 phosphatidate cytidylyltransferase [Novosphingobium pentaromativorans US6-1]EHJ60188.1 phosphatidate cytidylyltransferase [Novosphingobium pentaromativorans US6-1]
MSDAPKKSDLRVRTISAVVMVAVAGLAIWLGGPIWTAFVCAIAVGVLWEWVRLTRAGTQNPAERGFWNFAGMFYVGTCAAMLLFLRNPAFTLAPLLTVVCGVIAVDVGAYFAGRTFGGPKVAPAISPSKTWAGLFGAIAAATLVLFGAAMLWRSGAISLTQAGRAVEEVSCFGMQPCWYLGARVVPLFATCLMTGILFAICAQGGDFFESWLKRRAGVKDSGSLIPGHGGFFDRVDGLLAVLFVLGLMILFQPGS